MIFVFFVAVLSAGLRRAQNRYTQMRSEKMAVSFQFPIASSKAHRMFAAPGTAQRIRDTSTRQCANRRSFHDCVMSHGALGIGHGRCAVLSRMVRSKRSLMAAAAEANGDPERAFGRRGKTIVTPIELSAHG